MGPRRPTLLALLLIAGIAFIYLNSLTDPRQSTNSSNNSLYKHKYEFLYKDNDFKRCLNSTTCANLNKVKNLVIVAGHFVFQGADFSKADVEENWIVKNYLTGYIPSILEQIKLAVLLAIKDPDSLLIFSGGQTAEYGPRSEGESYWHVAANKNWYGDPSVSLRATTEDFSRDSYENVLFSICRFKEYTGHYPSGKITVIGFKFKEKRFRDVHRVALRWPARNFEYIGIGDDSTGEKAALEEEVTIPQFLKDPYSCSGPLMKKKLARNRFRRVHGFLETNAELEGLLNICANDDHDEWYEGPLPWDEEERGG